MANQPNRKTTLAPMLSVRRGQSAIEFYKRAFGAEELFRIEGDTGEVVAHLSVDGAEFWLADESLGGGSVRIVLVVDDPDSFFERAVSVGATAISPVTDQPYGWRVGRIADPFGHHWEIGKPLSEAD